MNNPLTHTRPSAPMPTPPIPQTHLRSRLRRWLEECGVENVLMTTHQVTVEFSDGHLEVHDLTTAVSVPAQKADHDHC